MSLNIKDLDENTYRNLKAEALRHGMKINQAATEAIRLWVAEKRQTRQRDTKRMQDAAQKMDELRTQNQSTWNGAKEIHRWRNTKKHSTTQHTSH